jgi:hypothetical protein
VCGGELSAIRPAAPSARASASSCGGHTPPEATRRIELDGVKAPANPVLGSALDLRRTSRIRHPLATGAASLSRQREVEERGRRPAGEAARESGSMTTTSNRHAEADPEGEPCAPDRLLTELSHAEQH